MRVKADPLSGVAGVCWPDWAGCLSSVCWPDWTECLAREASSARCIRWPESPKDGIRFGLGVRELFTILTTNGSNYQINIFTDTLESKLPFVWWGTLNVQVSSTTLNIHYTVWRNTDFASFFNGTKTGITSSETSGFACDIIGNHQRKIKKILLLCRLIIFIISEDGFAIVSPTFSFTLVSSWYARALIVSSWRLFWLEII